ncbi:MAG: hypothetical protein AB1Z98_20230 [Nannocystaceae bacterium]
MKVRASWARSWWIALSLVLAPAPVVAGASSPSARPEPVELPTTVYVVVGEQTDPRLREALDAARTNLAGQGVELRVVAARPEEPAAMRARDLVRGEGARGVFWIDERRPQQLRVFLLDSDGSAHVRRVPVVADSAEASREAVWNIVESGSLALASGGPVAMEEASTDELEVVVRPPPEPEPKTEPQTPVAAAGHEPDRPRELPTPPSPPRARGSLVVAYLAEGLASPIPWQSGLGLGGWLDLGAHMRLSLDYGLLLPWRTGDPTVTWRHRGELRAGPRWSVASRVPLSLHVLLGVGLEAARWLGDSGRGWRAVATAGLDGGLALRLRAPVWLVLEPGLAVVLNRFEFVECAQGSACTGRARRVALRPWRVRPRVRLGLRLAF